MAMAMKSDERSRFTDVFNEPIDRLLSSIRGYETKPLLPFTEALESISLFFNDIKDYVYVALHNSQNLIDDLTQEKSLIGESILCQYFRLK
jgi:hypothetical protein